MCNYLLLITRAVPSVFCTLTFGLGCPHPCLVSHICSLSPTVLLSWRRVNEWSMVRYCTWRLWCHPVGSWDDVRPFPYNIKKLRNVESIPEVVNTGKYLCHQFQWQVFFLNSGWMPIRLWCGWVMGFTHLQHRPGVETHWQPVNLCSVPGWGFSHLAVTALSPGSPLGCLSQTLLLEHPPSAKKTSSSILSRVLDISQRQTFDTKNPPPKLEGGDTKFWWKCFARNSLKKD